MREFFVLGLVGLLISRILSDDKGKQTLELQDLFDQFHSNIKLEENDEKAKLRSKRETLLKALRENLPLELRNFDCFNQGSYSMHTGVAPLDGNYDIDVGLIFDGGPEKHPNPVILKKRIRDALNTHGRTVVIRNPCVTVNYMRGEEIYFHVDLAIYVRHVDGTLLLARGKENSEASKRVWEVSDPKALTEVICKAFRNPVELAQYRRCIRYLKRWRQVQFSFGAPLSIGLTVAAKKWFEPRVTPTGKPNDLAALRDWVETMLQQFSLSLTREKPHNRLAVELPVAPGADLMGRMTIKQMEAFKVKLRSLLDALEAAPNHAKVEDACQLLIPQFGYDFPGS